MLLGLQYPDPLITSELTKSYPQLISHCKRVVAAAESTYMPPTIQTGWASSLRYMIPWPRTSTRRDASSLLADSSEAQKEEWRYKLWRWGFIGASVLAAATYLHFATIVIVVMPQNASRRVTSKQEVDAEEAEDIHEDEEEGVAGSG